MQTVYISLTLFPRPLRREIWLTVQPFVKRDELKDWLNGLRPDGSLLGLNYRMLTDFVHNGSAADLSAAQDMVPVPLAGDLSMTVGLRGAGAGTYIAHGLNDRTGVILANGGTAQRRFTLDNVRSSDREADANATARVPPSGPFAMTMVDQLRQLSSQSATDDDFDRIAHMLTLSFLGGTVRRFRPETVTRQDAVHLCVVDPAANLDDVLPKDPPGGNVVSVSHVSAAGLMLELDRLAPPATLKTCTGVDLWFHQSGSAPGPIPTVPSSDEENRYLAAWFQAFDFAALKPPAQAVTMTNEVALSSRVYVSRHLTPFAPATLTGVDGKETDMFRKPPETPARAGQAAPSWRQLSDINRLAVRTADGINPFNNANLTAVFHEMLEVSLVPYRSAQAPSSTTNGGAAVPPAGGAAAPNAALMQLTPTPASRDRFVALFGAVAATPDPGPTLWPAGAELYRADGTAFVTADQPRGATGGFVGAWRFAWDDTIFADQNTLRPTVQSLPTVLFWIVPPADTTAMPLTLVRPAAPPVTATWHSDAIQEPLGPRWEWVQDLPGHGVPLPNPATTFNAVSLAVVGGADGAAKTLIPAVAFADDELFALARDASSVEGVMTVSYPAEDPASAITNHVDPDWQYRLALANYNKLDVSAAVASRPSAPHGPGPDAGASTDPLNFWSECFAVHTEDQPASHPTAHLSTFHYRYGEPLYALDLTRDPDVREEAAEARAAFAERFARIGKYRRVSHTLQHTTGDTFALPNPSGDIWSDGGTYLHSQPPSLMSDLRRLGAGATTAPAFLTWSFADDHRTCWITVNPAFLAPADGGAGPGVPTSAWLALAELVNGTPVLKGRFRRFDFAMAANFFRQNPETKPRLSDGLVAVGALENTAWPLPAATMNTMRSWLAGGTTPTALKFSIDLGVAPDGTVLPPPATSCHVVELHLDLTRQPGTVPDPNARWDLVRASNAALDQLFGPDGQKTDPVPEMLPAFKTFAASLSNAWGSVAPTDPNASAGLTALLGGGSEYTRDGGAATGNAGGEWVVPDPAATVSPGSPIVAALLPLGFRPLASEYQSDVTPGALRRHAEALGMLIDAAPGDWRNDKTTLDAWRQWFATLSAGQADILALLLAAQALVVPAFDSDPRLGSEVARLVQDAAGDGYGAASGLRAAIRRSMLADPATFGTARAMLLTRLSGAPVPGDFMRLDMTRVLDETATHAESVRLPLAASLLTGASKTGIAFLETLGDARYDDFFIVPAATDPQPGVAPHGLEQVAAAGTARAPASLPLAGTHLPGPITAKAKVWLPSRQPLAPVVQIVSGSNETFNDSAWWVNFATPGVRLSRSGLLGSGILAAPRDDADAVEIKARIRDNPLPRPTERDRGRAFAMFVVTSDERNRFADDAFLLKVAVGGTVPAAPGGGGTV